MGTGRLTDVLSSGGRERRQRDLAFSQPGYRAARIARGREPSSRPLAIAFRHRARSSPPLPRSGPCALTPVLLQEFPELPALGRMLQLLQRLSLDLPDPLPRHLEVASYLLQGPRAAV